MPVERGSFGIGMSAAGINTFTIYAFIAARSDPAASLPSRAL